VSGPRFDLALPGLYKEKWREAYRAGKDDAPRLSSYQAPGGQPVPFIYKNLEFSGGQSVDTAEYPFFGLWSNESLNQKPQTITVHGYLRGEYYLQQRTAFLAALMITTSDDSPGFFDHPLWGRFKVVVESYTIAEAADENGQCEITLTLKRAGVSPDSRAAVYSAAGFIKPKEAAAAAVEDFSKTGMDAVTLSQASDSISTNYVKTGMDTVTLSQAFGFIKTRLLNIIGRIQAAQTVLNSITNEINGISNIIAQGIETPMDLAQVLVNSVFAITSAFGVINESIDRVKKYFFEIDNKRNVISNLFSAADLPLPIDAVTVKQAETKTAVENLYRIVCLCASAEMLMQMKDITRQKMEAYWNLYSKLENSIDFKNHDVYKAAIGMKSAISQTLKQTALSIELKKNIERPVPLLCLAHYLGCDDEKLRAMNFIGDSLIISGEISYV
jgi:hypothetical protein